MGSLHTVFVGHWGHEPLEVRFVVERFSADFRMLRNGTMTALKRSTTNHERFGYCSSNPRFMERTTLRGSVDRVYMIMT
jgi:hypothetical protein